MAISQKFAAVAGSLLYEQQTLSWPATCRRSAGRSPLLPPVLKGATVLKVLVDKQEPALLCQLGIGMAMHGCVGAGWMGRTSTRSGLTPLCQLNNLLRQNI